MLIKNGPPGRAGQSAIPETTKRMNSVANDVLDAAIDYARRGWSVVPMRSTEKKMPWMSSWGEYKSHRLSEADLRALFRERPGANVGAVTGKISGITVVDLDGPHAADLVIKATGGRPPVTRTHKSPHGLHFIYRYNPRLVTGARLMVADCDCTRNCIPKPCAVDVRNDGGIIMLPPSVFEGNPYKVARDIEIAAWPDPPKQLIQRPRTEALSTTGEVIQEGLRNASLLRVVGAARRQGATEAEILPMARAINQNRCKPPLSEREVEGVVKSVSRYEPNPDPLPETDEPPEFQWRTGDVFITEEFEPLEFVAAPYFARGTVAEISGGVKRGKTHFVLNLAKQVLNGGEFLGERVNTTGSVVYVSEEGKRTFQHAAYGHGLGHKNFHLLLLPDLSSAITWAEICAQVRHKAFEVDAVAVVFDTLSGIARFTGDSENDSGAATIIDPLITIASQDNRLVIYTRHDRKGGGEVGDSGRGSSAIAGKADMLLQLKNANANGHPNRRQLGAIGRYEVPATKVLDWNGAEYIDIGDARDVEAAEAMRLLSTHLPGVPQEAWPRATMTDSKELGGISESTLYRVLKGMVDSGKVKCEKGAGKAKPKAYGYWLPRDHELHTPTNELFSPHTPEKLEKEDHETQAIEPW